MKTKKNLFLPFSAAPLLAVVLASSSVLHAATFTWTGAVSASWVPNTGNWDPNPAVFGNTADLVFNTVTNGNMFLAFGRTVRSLSFGANIDSDVGVSFQISAGGATGYNLTFDTDAVAGNANVTVDSGATGNITLGSALGGTTLNPILADNLVVDHNGTGLLLFNRPFQAAAFGITKNGTGTMQTNNNNLLTGALNINAGTFIANTSSTTGLDLANFSAINLSGGTLQIGSGGSNKTYATGPLTVSSASTLEYKNTSATTYTAAFTGTGFVLPADLAVSFVLNADLAVKNTSTTTTLVNALNLSRPMKGSGDVVVSTYNNIAAIGDNFGLGRVLLGDNNSAWSGDLVISKGTVSLGGTVTGGNVNAAGTGDIIIGTAADPFGAGLTFFPGANVTYDNDIIVNTGGFRAIKGGNNAFSVTFTGDVTLNKDLTLDHTWSSSDRRISLNGSISGVGGLTITRAGGHVETTAVLTGASNYSGDTTVTTGASLSLARTCSLTSNIIVQTGARIGGAGSTTGSLNLNPGANYFFFFGATYAPMNVSGSVTIDNSFGILSLVGGSRGEPIVWENVAPGTYTLIGTTSSTFNTITNFGSGSALTVATGKTAYFQNGGGTSGGGLQLVVTGPSGYTDWQTANGASGEGLNEDHDDDGVDNGTEYFLGGNTSTSGFTPLPGVVANTVTWTGASAGYLGVYNIHFTVETSETLAEGNWVTAPIGTGPGTVSIPFNTRNVTYTFPTTGPTKFARLKVTGP